MTWLVSSRKPYRMGPQNVFKGPSVGPFVNFGEADGQVIRALHYHIR